MTELTEILVALEKINKRLDIVEQNIQKPININSSRKQGMLNRLLAADKEKVNEQDFINNPAEALNEYMQDEQNVNLDPLLTRQEKTCNVCGISNCYVEKGMNDFHQKKVDLAQKRARREIGDFVADSNGECCHPVDNKCHKFCNIETPNMVNAEDIGNIYKSGAFKRMNDEPTTQFMGAIPCPPVAWPSPSINIQPNQNMEKMLAASTNIINNMNALLHKQIGSTAPVVNIDPTCTCKNASDKLMEGFINLLNGVNAVMEKRLKDGEYSLDNLFGFPSPAPLGRDYFRPIPEIKSDPIADKLNKVIDALHELKLGQARNAKFGNVSQSSDNIFVDKPKVSKPWKKQV
jgi:hypothetical protein